MTGSLYGFNPDRLTPVASLNRVRIVDLPGLAMDAQPAAAVKGQTASDLLSARALVADLHDHAAALGLPVNDIDAQRLPILFDECFESPRAQVRAAAEEVAHHF